MLREELLAFVVRKVGDHALAEDLVQDAFARFEAAHVHDEKAWFYRVLRNAIIDRARRERSRARMLEAFAHELPQAEETRACQCVHAAKDALKPSYRSALQRIELEGVAVKDYAAEEGISANSAGVRIHRARTALRSQLQKTCCDSCFDCTCQ